MRDYLSKHSNGDASTRPAVGTDAEPSQETAIKANQDTVPENKAIAEPTTHVELAKVTRQKTESSEPAENIVKAEPDTKPTALDADASMTEAPQNKPTDTAVEEFEEDEINVVQDVDAIMADAETVDVTHVEEANVFDIDDGELSDASTVLLDQDELEQVYRNKNIPPATDTEAPESSSQGLAGEQGASQQTSQSSL